MFRSRPLPLVAVLTATFTLLTAVANTVSYAADSPVSYADSERTFKDGEVTAVLTPPAGFQDAKPIDHSGGDFPATQEYTVTTPAGTSSSLLTITWGIRVGTGTSVGKFENGKQAAEQSFQFISLSTPGTTVTSQGATEVQVINSKGKSSSVEGYLMIAEYSTPSSIKQEAVLAVPLGKSKSSGDNLYLTASFTVDIANTNQFTTVTTPTGQTPSEYLKSSIDSAARGVAITASDSAAEYITGDSSDGDNQSSECLDKFKSVKKSRSSVKGKALLNGSPAKDCLVKLRCKVKGKYKTAGKDTTNSKGRFKIKVRKSYRDELRKKRCRLESGSVKKRV